MPKFTFFGERTAQVELSVSAATFAEAKETMESIPHQAWKVSQTDALHITAVQNIDSGEIADYVGPNWGAWG